MNNSPDSCGESNLPTPLNPTAARPPTASNPPVATRPVRRARVDDLYEEEERIEQLGQADLRMRETS